MPWEIIVLEEVAQWLEQLFAEDSLSAQLVTAALDLLEERGPQLGRPLADTVQGSDLKNLKELRPGSSGTSEIRILFIFDPQRRAILLTAGDKSGRWSQWYTEHIPIAEARYRSWLDGADYQEERT